ncbi:MAG: Uma2 family endonuclease [Chloroflexia bacterium]
MASVARKTYTPEEYLELERNAEYKSEYINGEIYAMAGASVDHITISSNLLAEIHQQLKGKPCRVFNSDLRIKVNPTGMYTYPDITAVCGTIRLEDTKQDTLLNPTLIAEVLSPSTEAYDRGEKFAHYRKLPSLQEYILISQDKILVERYIRQGEDWLLSAFSDPNATLNLTSINCAIPIASIYTDVDFPSEPTSSHPQPPEV